MKKMKKDTNHESLEAVEREREREREGYFIS